jgi:Fe-S-cluster containining protein
VKIPPPVGANSFQAARNSEYLVAVEDIRKRGWRSALRSSHERLDAGQAREAASSSEKPACQRGCWYCCYLKVGVRPEEAFAIVEHVRDHFAAPQAREVREAVAANARIMRQASRADQLTATLKCAFLRDGACSIYEVRPARCRAFHAVNLRGCQDSYERPHDDSILTSFVPAMFTAAEAQREGYDAALRGGGFDSAIYEMNTALDECLTDPRPLQRFERGKPAFSRAVPGDS